jgi:hypothetical protein
MLDSEREPREFASGVFFNLPRKPGKEAICAIHVLFLVSGYLIRIRLLSVKMCRLHIM